MRIKTLITKATAFLCIFGVVMINNVSFVKAYEEASVMNVTANIIDNSVIISPNGGKFCNDGKLKIEISAKLKEASIYFTTNGTDPVCGTNGVLYSEPFTLLSGKTVKAISCYKEKQSFVVSQVFDVSADYCETSLKINKVYYNPDEAHQFGTCNNEGEWIEIYNPTKEAVNLKNWKICNSGACDVLSSKDLFVPARGYVIVSYLQNTWAYWNVPESAVKIVLGNAIGTGLNNVADMIALKNSSGQIIDQMNWGSPNASWVNYNSKIWNPALAATESGKIFGRDSNGYDTDWLSDWKVFALPTVEVGYPNGDEVWIVGETYPIKWTAFNNNGADADLSVDLYYSIDSGKTWAGIVRNTENDGVYNWRVPLVIPDSGSNYFTPSKQARVKVVATDYTRNFMLSNEDVSDKDFCPPVDRNLLTTEELALLETVDTTNMTFVDSSEIPIVTQSDIIQQSPSGTETDNDAETPAEEGKQDLVLNKEDDDYEEEEANESDEDDKEDIDTEETEDTEKTEDVILELDKNEDETSSEMNELDENDGAEVAEISSDKDLLIVPGADDAIVEFNLNS